MTVFHMFDWGEGLVVKMVMLVISTTIYHIWVIFLGRYEFLGELCHIGDIFCRDNAWIKEWID